MEDEEDQTNLPSGRSRPTMDELDNLSAEGKQKAEDRNKPGAQAQEQQAAVPEGTLDWNNPAAVLQALGAAQQGSQGNTKRPLVLERLPVPARTEITTEKMPQPIDSERGETYQKKTKYPAGYEDVSSYTEDEDGKNREDQAYDDYINAGFRENKNPNIENAVVTLASGDFEKYDPIFQSAAIEASYRQAAGEDVTMMDVLNGWQKDGLPKGLSGGGPGSGSQAFTDVNTRVDLTNEGEARRIVNNALAGALGREATKTEMKAFRKALNMNERENPVVTTTTGVRSASGSTSETTSEGGFDYTDYADRFAKSQEGYAEYQTATTYLDAFIGALESDSRVI